MVAESAMLSAFIPSSDRRSILCAAIYDASCLTAFAQAAQKPRCPGQKAKSHRALSSSASTTFAAQAEAVAFENCEKLWGHSHCEAALRVRWHSAQLAHDRPDERLRVTKQHQRVVQIIEWVVDSRKSRIHAALDHHDRACLVHIENWHAIDR